ncbi:17312_t:CDS:2 [Funneliformis geosporum]|nr:17312_t:CDS:2 [Funneliformis geosporum]
MALSNSRRGKKKNINTTSVLNNSVTSSLRDILNGIEKKEIQAKKTLIIKKKQEDSIVLSISQAISSKDHDLNVGYHDILPNLLTSYIQIPIDKINKLDNLAVNIKKDRKRTSQKKYGKENQDMICDEQSLVYDLIELDTAIHAISAKIRKVKKNILEKNISKVSKALVSSSVGKPDAVITDFSSISSKHTDIKINSNTQSILEKIIEEQLKQRTIINTSQESNDELKYEIFENRKLLQNILTILTLGSLTTINELTQQGGKPKQRLKRKNMKHIW